ncbi:MAG: hypothetical protein IBJ18_11540 [Phycisphaerales bacterium]|nr:hypothetical protein [Phycisphaerales bacterium]
MIANAAKQQSSKGLTGKRERRGSPPEPLNHRSEKPLSHFATLSLCHDIAGPIRAHTAPRNFVFHCAALPFADLLI